MMDLGAIWARRCHLPSPAAFVGGLAALLPLSAAEARKAGYNPPYAEIIVDAKTGRTLRGVNEDALRHPASLTKVMTLYLLFERLEPGELSLETALNVSSHAAAQVPSKLGVRAGSTITVENAIKAIVTKSANDVAVVLAENMGGSEAAFAKMMTEKARALGMASTVFRNASGLHDPEQVTTARDLTILAQSIQDRFPQFYPYFETSEFRYGGSTLRNHNRLLGRVEGVDGIKTGFTRASGFNLMTSARHDGRHVVAVVLGGRSGAIRDQTMTKLVTSHLPRAHAGARTLPMVTEAGISRPDAALPLASATPMEEPRRRTFPVQQKRHNVAQPPVAASWAIQVAMVNDEQKAKAVLKEAQSRSGMALKGASAFTEQILYGGETQYRARFSGFSDHTVAQKACEAVQRSGLGCFAAPMN